MLIINFGHKKYKQVISFKKKSMLVICKLYYCSQKTQTTEPIQTVRKTNAFNSVFPLDNLTHSCRKIVTLSLNLHMYVNFDNCQINGAQRKMKDYVELFNLMVLWAFGYFFHWWEWRVWAYQDEFMQHHFLVQSGGVEAMMIDDSSLEIVYFRA